MGGSITDTYARLKPENRANLGHWPGTGTSERPEKRALGLRPEILIAPARDVNSILLSQLYDANTRYHTAYSNNSTNSNSTTDKDKYIFKLIRELYPIFTYSDLTKHPAIILLPYQVSFMSFFEYYRMGIPMFIPSPSLLARWDLHYNLLIERTWSSVLHYPRSSNSIINKHIYSNSNIQYDPNNEVYYDAIKAWISLSDFYTFPYITTFESWDDLLGMLYSGGEGVLNNGGEGMLNSGEKALDLLNISRSMLAYHATLQHDTILKWKRILHNIHTNKHMHTTPIVPTTPTPAHSEGVSKRKVRFRSDTTPITTPASTTTTSTTFDTTTSSPPLQSLRPINRALYEGYGVTIDTNRCYNS